jgi:tetratricopeptide (TPR) repeat protein
MSRLGAGLAMTILLCSMAAAPDVATAIPDPCATHLEFARQAESLAADGELATARAFVEAAADQAELRDCVAAELSLIAAREQIAQASLQKARDAQKVGDRVGAATAYLEALAVNHSLSEARSELDALLSVSQPEPDPFAAAKRLADAGFIAEAKDAAIKALQENAAAKPANVPTRVKPDTDGWWISRIGSSTPEWIRETVRWPNVGVLLAWIFGVFAIGLLTMKARSQPPKGSHMKLGWPMYKLVNAPGLRAVLRPSVTFTTDEVGTDVKAGAALREAISANLTRDSRSEQLDRAGPGDLSTMISDLVVTLPGLSAVGKLASKVATTRTITISLTLDPATTRQVSGTLSVTDWRGHTFDAQGFKASIIGAAADGTANKATAAAYLTLAPQMTAWLAFTLRRLWNPRGTTPTIADTTSWSSYTSFLSGLELQRQGDPAGARVAYLRALADDRFNRSAMINLGAIDCREHQQFDHAISLLQRAQGTIAGGLEPWAQATYLLAVTHLHRGTLQHTPADLLVAKTLAIDLCHTLKQKENGVDDSFVKANLPAAQSLLLSTEIVTNGPLATGLPVATGTDDASFIPLMDKLIGSNAHVQWTVGIEAAVFSFKAQYNVACTYARAFSIVPALYASRDGLANLALMHLERALRASPSLVPWAETQDPALATVRAQKPGEWNKLFESLRTPTPSPPTSSWSLTVH